MKIRDEQEDVGFTQILSIKLGDGAKVPFQTKRWIENSPLCVLCPNLFQVIKDTSVSVQLMGRWENNR